MKNTATWGKRIFFFLFTNFLIVSTLYFAMTILMNYFQIELQGFTFYLVFYTIIGMGGAFVNLWMSKWLAIQFMGVRLLEEKNFNEQERELVRRVHNLAIKAGLPAKPAVGIYESDEVNAFATGPSKKRSLVAVSSGLLNQMNDQEVEGVLAHEVSHIANGDMVTMCLIQGLVNVMVFLIARLLAKVVVNAVLRDRENWFMEYIVCQIFALILFIPGSMLVCFFSRWREYRADHGGAQLAGRDKMVSALTALSQISQAGRSQGKKQYSYLMINNNSRTSLMAKLFSTHPPLPDRIKRLKGFF